MSNLDNKKIIDFVNKWMPLLQTIQNDKLLKERCKRFNAYILDDDSDELEKELCFVEFLKEAYDSGIVVSDYSIFTDGKEELVSNPTDVFLTSLSKDNVMRCIAYHFRRDHFVEGSLISESFVNGSLLKLFLKMNN